MIIESGLSVFEGMTSISALIRAFEASPSTARRIVAVYYSKDLPRDKFRQIGFLKSKSAELGFDVAACDASDIDSLTSGKTHGGIIAVCTDRQFPAVCADALKKNGIYFMLEGIEDPYNFGYSLRSLYACGCTGILLPERNWMSAAGVVCRSSAGASERFTMYTSDSLDIIRMFKQKGYTVVCADENTENILGKCALPLPILLLVGGEKRGISRKVLEEADLLVKIDYAREFRASLSAASATTMFAYEIARQNF